MALIKIFRNRYVPQVVATYIGCIICFSDGMAYGWTSPMIPKLESPDSPIAVAKTDETWMETVMLIGTIVGLPITTFALDRVGRKACMLISAALAACSWTLLAFADRIATVLAARFFLGTAGLVAFIAGTIYVAEISEKQLRGFLISGLNIMMLVGLMVIYSAGPYVSVAASSLLPAALLVFELCTFGFVPESPYYLLMKGQREKARRSLAWFRNTEDVDAELEEIVAAVARQQSERGKPQDLFLVDSNRKGMAVMAVVNASVHFVGFTALLMNMHSVLSEAGSDYLSENFVANCFAGLMFLSNFLSSILVDRCGRKILLVVSSFLTGLSLFMLASCFTLKRLDVEADACKVIPMASVLIYAVVFKLGLGTVVLVLPGELFPTKVKSVAVTASELIHTVAATASVYIYKMTANAYGVHVPIYLFAVVALGNAVFAFYFVPETKGKSLEEIQLMLKGVKKGNETNKVKM